MGDNRGEKEAEGVLYINGENYGELLNICIPCVSLDGVCIRDRTAWPRHGAFTAKYRIRYSCSRKRFVKFLMSNGYSRNHAQRIAEVYHKHGYTWRQAFIDFVLVE